MASATEITEYYTSNQGRIIQYFLASGAGERSQDMAQDVACTLLKHADHIKDVPRYASGCLKRMVWMMYRSKDFQAVKIAWDDNVSCC